jgi:hypothetical protein
MQTGSHLTQAGLRTEDGGTPINLGEIHKLILLSSAP